MDKLKALYDSYIQQGILSSQTTFEQFSSADTATQENLYKQGVDNKILSSQTDINTFQSAWGEVKKKDESVSIVQEDVTESIIPEVQEEVISSDASYQRDDSIADNDYLVGLSNGSIKTNEGSVATISEVINAATEQGYSQDEIDSLMVGSSSDPTDSMDVSEVQEVVKPNWQTQIDELGESASVWNDPSAEGVSTEEIREYYLSTQQPESVPTDSTLTEQEDIIPSDIPETIIPKKRKGVRLNFDEDGNVVGESTHLMKREFIPEEGWVAFPSLFQDEDGAWIDMSNKPDDEWHSIYKEAKSRGEVYNFGTDKQAAIDFADKGSWKSKTLSNQESTITTPTELDQQIYQGIYGRAIEQGDTSVPTIEEWLTNEGISGASTEDANEEALGLISTLAKNVEHAYDESFLGDVIRSVGASANPALQQMNLSKKIAKISSDENLTDKEKKEKIDGLSVFDAVYASEPLINITDYTPEETNEFAVGIMSTLLDFAATPTKGVVSGIARVAGKVLPSKTFLGIGKTTYDALRGLGLGKQPAINIIKKQLPQFAKRLDAAGTQFGVFDVAKDFQQQVDQYGGINEVDFTQSPEAFAKGYGLGAGLGLVGELGRVIPKLGTALKTEGATAVKQKGITEVLADRGLSNSRIIGTAGETIGLGGEAVTFGLINATTPTKANPEGELTAESFKEGVGEAFKYIFAFRGVGLAKKIAAGQSVFNKQYSEFNKAEKEKAWSLMTEINKKIESGEISPKKAQEYLDGVILRGEAPITLIEKVVQEISGMKSNITRDQLFNKVFDIKAQAKTDGSYEVNTFSKDGLWLGSLEVAGPAEVSQFMEAFKKERALQINKTANGEGNYPLSNRVNYSINPQPLLEAPTTTVDGDDVTTTTNIVTEEYAAQKLIEEGVQNATPEEVKQKQQELLKEQANAIQEPSTETVDVQEQTGDSQTVGERDTEVSELTTETTQEVQESDVSPEVQAEIDAIEADDTIDLSELDAITPTEEATSNLERIEEFYDGEIEGIQEEITLEQGNTKEGIAEIKSKIADVRKDKSLSRDDKFEAIEDLKGELFDFKQEQGDIISTYKDDIRVVKAEMKADIKEAKKSTPEFRRKTVNTLTESQNTEKDIETANILEVLNQRADNTINVSEITETEATPSQINVQALNERTGGDFKEFDINTLNDVPVMWNISDQLITGKYNPNINDVNQNYSVTNPYTGNQITNLKGGLGFSSVKGHENIAWASVTTDKVSAQQKAGKEVYDKNPAKFDKLWADGVLPDGHIPMVIVKMGNDSMKSNEAMIRVISDNLESFPKKNKKAALKALKEQLKVVKKSYQEVIDTGLTKKGKKAKGLTITNYLKFIGEIKDVQNMIKVTKPKSIEDVLSTENLKSLKGISSVVQITNLMTTGNFDVLKKEPSKGKKPVIKALYGESPSQQDINKFNTKKIADVITEPELSDVPQRSAFMVTAIDIKNPQTIRTSHPNYPVGPKGKVLGILKQPISIIDLVPAAYNNVALGISEEISGQRQSRSDKARLVQTVPVQAGLANRELLGTPIGINTDKRFLDFLQRSFPHTNMVVDANTFNGVMQRDGVKEYLKDGDVIYGVTVRGRIFINPEVHDTSSALFNTSIHEMGHVWTDYLQTTKKGREIYAKGIELVKETDTYKEQLEIFNGDEAKAANEAMAILIGNKGESITNESINSKWRDWLIGLWDYIKSQFKQFKDLTSKEIQDLTLDQFLGTALRDILGGKPIKLTPKQRETMKAAAAFRKMSPSNKKIVRSAVEKLRGLGYSEVVIGKLLKQKGFESNLISEVLATNKKAAPKAKVTEDLVPGSKKVENAINDIIKRTQERADKKNNNKGPKNITPKVSQEVLLKNAIEYLKSTPLYERASDVVREELVRGVRKKLSLKEKSAPSVGKVLGVIKDVKKITIREKDLLKLRMQEAVKAAKGAVDFSKKFKADIANDLYALVDKGQLTQRQAVVLAKSLAEMDIKSQKSIDRFTDYVEKVFNDSTGKYKQSVIKDIVKFVSKKSKKALTDSNKVRGKGLDTQGQAFFQASKRVLSRILEDDLNPEAVEKEFFPNIEEILYKEGELTTKEQAQLDSYIAFETFKGIEDMSVQEVEQLFKDIRNESSESISRLKEKLAIEKAELIKLRDVADSDIGKGFPELYEDGKLLDVGVAQNKKDVLLQIMEGELYTATKEYVKKFNPTEPGAMLNAISNNLKLLGTLTNGLDKQGDFFTKNVYKNLNNMESNYIKGLQSTRTTLDDIASSIKGVKNYKDIVKKLDNTSEESLKGKLFGVHKVTGITTGKGKDFFKNFYSGDQLLRIYALSKNPIQREKLRRQGFTDTKIEEIKEKLGFEVVEFADKVVDYLSTDYFEQTNKVYSDVNNVNLNYVENYFPTRTVTKDVSVLDIKNGDFNSVFNAQVADALKSRADIGSDVNIKDTDFTTALENHFNSVERYKAYARGVKNLNLEFNFNSVRTLLEVSGMKSVIRNAVNFAVNPNGGQKAIQPSFVDKLMTKYTGFVLAFKLMQIPKQATSFVLAFEDYNYRGEGKKKIPGLDLLMFMVDQAKTIATLPIAIKDAYNTSPIFKERIKRAFEGDISGLETGSVTFKPVSRQSGLLGKARRAFKTSAGAFTAIGDIAGVMGYWGSYKRDIANGMSEEKALKKFEDFNTTQQSRRPADKIPLQMSSNAYVRSFTMFGSTLFLQMNKVMQAFTNISRATSRGKIPKAKDTRALILNLGLANVLFQLTANIFKYLKGDDEDAEEVMTTIKDAMSGLNLIYQVPFFGAAVELLVNKYRGTNRPIDVAVNPLSSLIRKGMKIAKDDKPVEAVVRTAAEIIMGTQFDPFIGLYEGVSSGFGDKESYDVIGVSKSYRPSEKKKSKPMTKTQMKEDLPELYQITKEFEDLDDFDLGLEDF